MRVMLKRLGLCEGGESERKGEGRNKRLVLDRWGGQCMLAPKTHGYPIHHCGLSMQGQCRSKLTTVATA
jgi:hypothetical protein